MVIEPKEGFSENADVCIIGSGAGGAIVAKELSEDTSLNIVLLEKGDYFRGEDFDQRPEIRSHLYQDGGGRLAKLNFLFMKIPVTILQGTCIGGTTTINEATCFDTPPLILERWKEKYKVENLSEEDLKPYFKKIRDFINVHRLDIGMVHENGLVIKKGVEGLVNDEGKKWRGELLEQNRKDCVECGFCHLGCRYNRKQSMLVTAIPAAARNGARIYSNCSAEKIILENGRAVGVEGNVVKKLNGKCVNGRFSVKAKLVVMAGGAVNSSQLLLKSGITVNKRVGKNLSFQPGVNFFAEFPKNRINCYKGIPQGYVCEEFSIKNRDEEHGWVMEDLGYHPSAFVGFNPLSGLALKKVMKNYRYYSTATSILQDEPNGEVKIKKDGSPVISYSMSKGDREKMKHAIKESCRVYFKAGAKQVVTPLVSKKLKEGSILTCEEDLDLLDEIKISAKTLQVMTSTHIQGGNCMGGTKDAVVNSNCRVKDIDNLFIADASVHPTSIGVNPQLTIMAISAKTANHIKQNQGNYFN